MAETVRLTQSTDAIALTLIATPVSNQQLNLTLGVKLTQGQFPLGQGNIKYGFTGGTLTIHCQDAHLTTVSDQIQNYLPITNSPTPDHPSWQFALAAGLNVLETDADAIPLGTVRTTSDNWSVDATLTVGQSDILITEVEGLWRHDLRPNQQAVLHRKIALFLLETYLPSPVISLQREQSTNETAYSSDLDPSLLTILETIKTASSHDFLELCQMAELNPRFDLAGANLRGTTLRGLDFSGANWSRVNLRGADLTDTDLSDGNLDGAKLSGADLSGAYLSNANLKDTDFHRASLALANLSGANLQGANLQGAKLSQTNFNDCHLEGAKFD